MRTLKVNKKGQFSIIAAILVAVVLIAAVMTTYSAIRYSSLGDQPQVLSAIDEINLALKQVLGFTVGYYGSVLQVTGNVSYAKTLASNYLRSGLENIGDIRPEWGPSFNITTLDLRTNWFAKTSSSSGNFSVKYDLTGIGVYGMTYSTTSRLEVQILPSSPSSHACLSIFKDESEPLISLAKQNLKFYRYLYSSLTWELVTPSSEPTAFANGTYIIDVPSGIDPTKYIIKIEDTRGIMVVASSFSQYAFTPTWNTTSIEQGFYYVDNNISDVDSSPDKGTQSNFTAQQYGPDSIYDTLTEAASGTYPQNYYPTYRTMLGSTTWVSGTIPNDLQSDNGLYFQLHSYPSAFSGSANLGYSSKGGTSQSIENRITGSEFTVGNGGQAQTISVYLRSTSNRNRNVKAAIYSNTNTLIARTEQKTITPSTDGWVTFNFIDPNPMLTANTNYILVAWADNAQGDVLMYRDAGSSNQGHYDSRSYGNWPDPGTFSHENLKYSIYCTYSLATQYTCEVEFTGTSDTMNWVQLPWTADSAVTAGAASLTLQLYDFATGQYSTSGDGYMTATLGTNDLTQTQTINVNPTNFRNSTGYWKLKFKAVNSTSAQFDLKIDLAKFAPEVTNYALDLEEQWTNVNATNPRKDLCIKTGALGSENLLVDVRSGSSWITVINSLQPNTWNNVSVAPYINSPTLTIRFRGSNDASDPVQDSWNVDAVFLKAQPDIDFLSTLQDSTIVIELIQNGTMRWLGQNLQLTTQAVPIPPVPAKAIHVNQTINGVDQEMPFQIEDWASEYRIPLGLTSNTTVFSNRQMIVFQMNNNVSKFTIWWNGSDEATQTPLAYTTSPCFTGDDPNNNRLTNGKINLQFGSFSATSTVIGTTTSSTANFMRINDENSVYGAGAAYVIHHGVVRDIVQQEAEWGTSGTGIGGADGCPNLYANIVITLPANVTYYTYQLRLMFINSAQSRVITDLCPIRLTVSPSSLQAMTENRTANGFPTVTNGTGTFYNYSAGSWTAHHWSQLVSGSKGAGIMFTDTANQRLYAFDSIAGSAVGAIDVDTTSKTIELLPVARNSASFTNALDITWRGAVVTFDNTTPIYTLQGGTPTGLWILAEYQPTITVTAET